MAHMPKGSDGIYANFPSFLLRVVLQNTFMYFRVWFNESHVIQNFYNILYFVSCNRKIFVAFPISRNFYI